MASQELLRIVEIAGSASDRFGLWTAVAGAFRFRDVCEIGVYEGDFAAALLSGTDSVERYFMVDPWRHLEGWNKPLNGSDSLLESAYGKAMTATAAWSGKRVVLRDVSKQALRRIEDGSLDFAYIDGDHTLRGITIDLVNLLPKMRKGGVVAGDDFVKNIWQHGVRYSPTEVHPFALYFAEAHGLPFASLPFEQFCIVNDPSAGFEWVDRGGYAKLDPVSVYVAPQVPILQRWKTRWRKWFPAFS
jgi:hypothetical protein